MTHMARRILQRDNIVYVGALHYIYLQFTIYNIYFTSILKLRDDIYIYLQFTLFRVTKYTTYTLFYVIMPFFYEGGTLLCQGASFIHACRCF